MSTTSLSLPTAVVEELLRVQGEELLRVRNESKASETKLREEIGMIMKENEALRFQVAELNTLRKENEELRIQVAELEKVVQEAETPGIGFPTLVSERLNMNERDTANKFADLKASPVEIQVQPALRPEAQNFVPQQLETDDSGDPIHPFATEGSAGEESESIQELRTNSGMENDHLNEDTDDALSTYGSTSSNLNIPRTTEFEVPDIEKIARMHLKAFCTRQSPYKHLDRFRKNSSPNKRALFIPGDEFIIDINKRHEGYLVCPVGKLKTNGKASEHKFFKKFASKMWRGELILRRGADWVYSGTYETSTHTFLSANEFTALPKKTRECVCSRMIQGLGQRKEFETVESILAQIVSGKLLAAKVAFRLVGYDHAVQEGLLDAAKVSG